MKKIFTLLLVLSSLWSFSQSTTLVISQVYGAGGNSGAVLNADYVELHNISGAPISLSGYTIQYATAALASGANWTGVSPLPAVSIPAGGYYLIQMTTAGANGAALPTPDYLAAPTIAMAAASGRVALVNGLTALVGCPAAGSYVDLVGYGTSTCFEGAAPTTAISTTLAAFRNNNGCTDTDNNGADFSVLAPAPRNGATTPITCGAVSPSLTATTLTAFGNVCINTTAGPNSFTITGSNLTNADVTVGALAGFTYATAAGGPYSASLTLPQPGGSFSQQVFVQFNPTAVQSYNGNIALNGGGTSAATNVAASGSGINGVTVTTGAASAITTTTATCAGTYTSACAAVTAYGIEYSTTNGFPNGSGTAVPSTNQVAGAFTSDLSGLASGVTYYYHAYATNANGTVYGTQQQFTTVSLAPTITVTSLTAFGNVCINTTAGPNSFTVNGTNLTNANITVGPLAGYTFSTTSGGTYTASLNLTQPGGTYTQQVFVNFTPTAVQSYNGNIPVTGGGATATSAAASGSGVNTAASVTTGNASAITISSATLAGSITATGCSAVTAYGIEYSTTNNFPNGTGTQVASTNLAAGNFTSNVSGLTPATVYYYKAYATNAGGTTYGTQKTFTTLTPVLTASTLTAFGAICINTTSDANSFTISTTTGITNANVTVGPLAGYSFSTSAGGTYTASLSLTQPGGAFNQVVFVKFTPTASQSYNGNIPVGGGGATTINISASGTGVNTAPTATTGNVTVLSPNSANLFGSIADIGCSNVTEYGIEYSGINNFPLGIGTKVAGSNLSGPDFSVNVNSLVQATTYYYRAYAINNGGISYGDQESFTTSNIPAGLVIYNSPISRGGNVHYTLDNIKPGHYQVKIINSIGQLVFQRELILQVNFIDDNFTLPANIRTGLYTLQVFNYEFKINKQFMVR